MTLREKRVRKTQIACCWLKILQAQTRIETTTWKKKKLAVKNISQACHSDKIGSITFSDGTLCNKHFGHWVGESVQNPSVTITPSALKVKKRPTGRKYTEPRHKP